VLALHFERCASLADPARGSGADPVQVIEGEPEVRLRAGIDDHVENTALLHWQRIDQGQNEDAVWLHVRTRATNMTWP
jgi:trehalose/maltose hydrolase-like predicted phosphorylase